MQGASCAVWHVARRIWWLESHLQLEGYTSATKWFPNEKRWVESARVNYSLWRPGSERNKTGAGAQHTLASTEDTDPGGQQGWPAQRHCTPRGPTRGTGSREAGEEGSSDLQRRRHQCRGNDRWRCEQESRGTPQEKGVCNHIVISYPTSQGLPDGSVGKNLPVKAGDTGSIPGSGRSPREGNSNPLQYPWLGNPKDRGAWWAPVLGVAKVRHGLVTKRQ